ncbi:DUF502 domain-containing protein [Pararhizobium mangrovi]|uniref:DUF502 domain-containing protein n=1 Tax=Pararhizobium mangrovi TaxID=2590452 RepID=A0A506UDA6_9HYPH|nr:DUF502 domain-containing protein [Pararhizobium mangrovi]TPW31920.1 DUF502 domain-containing protein [Pararhizobium mangrovi]
MKEKPKRMSATMRLRNYFLTGLVICAPLVITLYLTWSFVVWVDGWVKPYLPKAYTPDYYLPYPVPGFGLLIALIVITLIGFLTANLIGRTVVGFGESILDRMPFIRVIYKGLKQLFQTILAESESSFQKVGLIEYPRKGLWSLVFIATQTHGEVGKHVARSGRDPVSVFLPTTPNPTSGYLLFVPSEEITILDMSVEDAAKMIISASLVYPEHGDEPGSESDVTKLFPTQFGT